MLDYSKIKRGDILYESAYGMTIEIQVITDPEYKEIPEEDRSAPCEDWIIKFTAKSGKSEINYSISPVGLMCNCGRLSKHPEYSGKILRLSDYSHE